MYICRFCITYVGFESCISETLQAMVASDNIIIHTNSYNAGTHLTQKNSTQKYKWMSTLHVSKCPDSHV